LDFIISFVFYAMDICSKEILPFNFDFLLFISLSDSQMIMDISLIFDKVKYGILH